MLFLPLTCKQACEQFAMPHHRYVKFLSGFPVDSVETGADWALRFIAISLFTLTFSSCSGVNGNGLAQAPPSNCNCYT
jgi:hypothetical protein